MEEETYKKQHYVKRGIQKRHHVKGSIQKAAL